MPEARQRQDHPEACARGLSQEDLAEAAGVSRRTIACYEREGAEPPWPQLPAVAAALRVTTDELLGVKSLTDVPRPTTARLMKRLQQVEALPPADQRAVLKVVDALLASRGRSRSAS